MKFDLGWACVQLLPNSPYSVHSQSPDFLLGLAFERQRGVHAVADGERHDFDAWPGALACTAPGVNVFSESAAGGEYLTLHVAAELLEQNQQRAWKAPRTVFQGSRRAMALCMALRRMLLTPHPDPQHFDEVAALLLAHGLSLLSGPPQGSQTRAYANEKQLAGTLNFIEDQLHEPLTLQTLADTAQLPPPRFLRLFTRAVGTTPHAYVSERRLQRARQLLRTSGLSIASVALECGFAHQSHMGAAFKAKLGCSPKQYRADRS
ncbi:MAG: hypothetical protein RIS44_1981 [Pseudomonadota bacterium]|jgi:AraC-like DNA-binding protein